LCREQEDGRRRPLASDYVCKQTSTRMAMKLYTELAEFWPVWSSPDEYKQEARHFARVLKKSSKPAPRTVLDLGSGGGHTDSHLKARFQMPLVDISPGMLAGSRELSSACARLEGATR